MTDVAVQLAEREAAPVPVASESASFPELVWAHFKWEQDVHADRSVSPGVESRYRATLKAFEREHGRILEAYWSTTCASAVAVTVKRAARPFNWLGKDPTLRFHRATEWVIKDAPTIADVMQRCDTLAIRASEVLRGTSERIALQRIFNVASHLLGFLDRLEGKPSDVELRHVTESQTRELRQVRDYYFRAGANAGRIVYFWGMMIGLLSMAALAPLVWLIMRGFDVSTSQLKTFFACYAAGAVGAIVSVMSRMSKADTFKLDFEVGRPALRRIGSFRPQIGAVFGVLTYFVLESGMLDITKEGSQKFFYYGTLAFVAGFSERWTKVLLGAVEAGSGIGGGGSPGPTVERDRRVTTG
jgi:hypothetical protein